MRESRSRAVNLMAPQSGCDKAKLLNFKSVWLRGCKDRGSGCPGIPDGVRLADCDARVTNRRENWYEFGLIAVCINSTVRMDCAVCPGCYDRTLATGPC